MISQYCNTSEKKYELIDLLTMPLTFIVWIFWMNFEFIQGLHTPIGYSLVLVIMGLITLAIYAWFEKKRRL